MGRSSRSANFFHIVLPANLFLDLDAAVRCANAICAYLTRLWDKKPHYAIAAAVCVSENDGRLGRVVAQKCGKRGRPSKVFDGTGKAGAHIHILLLANPGWFVLKQLKAYLNNKFSKAGLGASDNIFAVPVTKTPIRVVHYVLDQCLHIRRAHVDPGQVLIPGHDCGFFQAFGQVESAHGFIFTSSERAKTLGGAVLLGLGAKRVPPKYSQCNNYSFASCSLL